MCIYVCVCVSNTPMKKLYNVARLRRVLMDGGEEENLFSTFNNNIYKDIYI